MKKWLAIFMSVVLLLACVNPLAMALEGEGESLEEAVVTAEPEPANPEPQSEEPSPQQEQQTQTPQTEGEAPTTQPAQQEQTPEPATQTEAPTATPTTPPAATPEPEPVYGSDDLYQVELYFPASAKNAEAVTVVLSADLPDGGTVEVSRQTMRPIPGGVARASFSLYGVPKSYQLRAKAAAYGAASLRYAYDKQIGETLAKADGYGFVCHTQSKSCVIEVLALEAPAAEPVTLEAADSQPVDAGQNQADDPNANGGQDQNGDPNVNGGQGQTGDSAANGGQSQAGEPDTNGGQDQTGDPAADGGQNQPAGPNADQGQSDENQGQVVPPAQDFSHAYHLTLNIQAHDVSTALSVDGTVAYTANAGYKLDKLNAVSGNKSFGVDVQPVQPGTVTATTVGLVVTLSHDVLNRLKYTVTLNPITHEVQVSQAQEDVGQVAFENGAADTKTVTAVAVTDTTYSATLDFAAKLAGGTTSLKTRLIWLQGGQDVSASGGPAVLDSAAVTAVLQRSVDGVTWSAYTDTDGNAVKAVLNRANGWTCTFDNLPATAADGTTQMSYRAVESETPASWYTHDGTPVVKDGICVLTNLVAAADAQVQIDNMTQNPVRAATNVGGYVAVEGDNWQYDISGYTTGKTTVSWKNEANWFHRNTFRVSYQEAGSSEWKNVTCSLGDISALKQVSYFRSAAISQSSANGITAYTLSLARSAAELPAMTRVEIGFDATLAVENTTYKNRGGQVGINSWDDGYDGRYTILNAAGYASSGYVARTNYLQIGNPGEVNDKYNKNGSAIRIRKTGDFKVYVSAVLAGERVKVPVTGSVVVYKRDSYGNPIHVCFRFDSLPIPLDVGIPFTTYASNYGPQTGDPMPAVAGMMAVSGVMLFVLRDDKRKKTAK